MSYIAWIVLGLIAGAIAKAIMPGKDPGGFIITCLIGIVGAFVGGFLGRLLFHTTGTNAFDFRTLLTAIVGSLILLWVYRLATRSRV